MRCLCCLALLLAPSLAAADRVTVKGTVLEGKVESISAKEIELKTVYGKGTLTIETADVEAIETDAAFHVFHGDDAEAVGKVVGVTPDALRIAQPGGGSQEIPFGEVDAAPRDPGPDANWFERRAVEQPYWGASVDASFGATRSSVDTTSLATGFTLRRERGPHRLRFGASYLRATTQDNFGEEDDPTTPDVDESKGTEDEEITADELRGFIRQEYDLTERVFALGSLEAEHDGLEELNLRLIPKLGLGYKLVNTETALFKVDSGLAYVRERYFRDGPNGYFAAAFGAEADAELPFFGARWQLRADYLPSLADWSEDYRLRGETALSVPLVEQVSVKLSVVDDYNSQPAEDTAANSLATLLGLSLEY